MIMKNFGLSTSRVQSQYYVWSQDTAQTFPDNQSLELWLLTLWLGNQWRDIYSLGDTSIFRILIGHYLPIPRVTHRLLTANVPSLMSVKQRILKILSRQYLRKSNLAFDIVTTKSLLRENQYKRLGFFFVLPSKWLMYQRTDRPIWSLFQEGGVIKISWWTGLYRHCQIIFGFRGYVCTFAGQ